MTYVTNATSQRDCACVRMRGMRLAESGTGRIWAHHTGNTVSFSTGDKTRRHRPRVIGCDWAGRVNAGYEPAVVRSSDTSDSCSVRHRPAGGQLAQRPRPLTGGCLRGLCGSGGGGVYIRYENKTYDILWFCSWWLGRKLSKWYFLAT